MAPSAAVITPKFLKHDPGEFHPESPDRLKVLIDLTRELEGKELRILHPRAATREEIEACHSSRLIDLIRSTTETNRTALDGDTVTCSDSYETALLAAGGYLKLLDSIAAGEFQNGFALVRPPGHHAMRDRAMGFCLFNSVAIGAEHLKRRYGAKRILIMDWDVHHGNGTQDAFYQDPSVLYISTHQYPFYPGTGAMGETGEGKGEGTTVNIPLPAGCGDAEYLQVFKEIVVPVAEKYEPDWILVSAGFDSHLRDPLGSMRVTVQGFEFMASALLKLAQNSAAGRIAFLLEGGYNLYALKESVAVVLKTMTGAQQSQLPASTAGVKVETLIREILSIQGKYH